MRLLRVLLLGALLSAAVACGTSGSSATTPGPAPLRVGAIPDQDPEQLQRLYGAVAGYLESELGVAVEYVPVTDYGAAVSLFRTGDLDLVWFGGLTGVQARLQTPGAQVIAQRDVDAAFHSVFVANTATSLEPFDTIDGLARLAGTRFTFGSESSTSGRLMPQHFLAQAGVSEDDFAGAPGFSRSHDQTIDLVESGTYQAGVLNEQVWRARVDDGSVDATAVRMLWRTPAYHDYHWLLGPSAAARFGDGFAQRVRGAFLELTPHRHPELLALFGARAFIPAAPSDYADIEQVARDLGLIRG